MKKRWLHVLLFRRFIVVLLLLLQAYVLIEIVTSRSHASAMANVALTVVSFLAVLHIISEKEKGGFKLAWVFLILLFPVFGGLFYLLFCYQTDTKRFSRLAERALSDDDLALTWPKDARDEAIEALTPYRSQVRYLQDFAGFPVYDHSETEYLTPGEQKFERLVEELHKAERYIFLEYFIVQEGVMWNAILEILKEKAKQGVKVRLMYDDIGCFFLLPEDYPRQLGEYGIECVVFNAFKPFLTVKQNNRDHRKIAVIDGKVAFTGGINLADEYINAIDKHGHWKDASVMVKGKAAWSFTVMFLRMWSLAARRPEDVRPYYPWKDAPCETPSDGFVQPYGDSPMDKENVGEHVYLHILNSARDYVYINTPYLIIDDSLVSALTLAAKSGVDVRIVTPHRWDKWAVHMTTRSYYRELIRSGVKIYEYTKGFIHAKTFVADDRIATVGTTNLDYRSLYLHFECGAVLYGGKAVMQVKEDFLKTLEICQRIREEDCDSNVIKRLIQEIFRLFAPLM